jgi:hypothetical protein
MLAAEVPARTDHGSTSLSCATRTGNKFCVIDRVPSPKDHDAQPDHIVTPAWRSIADREINPIARGWMQYYRAFYRSALLPLLRRVNSYLMRWLRKKYKRLASKKKARACWERITAQYPRLFAHWAWVPYSWWSG